MLWNKESLISCENKKLDYWTHRIKKVIIMTKHIEKKRVSNIEKLFLNYTDKYEKINLNWDNEVGKEIWYNDEEKK